MATIITIAGPMGAGKSTLAHQVAQMLGNAAVLEFDAYERASSMSIPDLQVWRADGADFDKLAAPRLAEDLAAWRAGGALRLPNGTMHPPCQWLIFEMPLGRCYTPTAEMIDLLVWIDLPLELALARKIAQFISRADRDPERIRWLAGFLQAYQVVVRDILLLQQQRVRPDADLIVDGQADLPANAAAIASAVQTLRLSPRT